MCQQLHEKWDCQTAGDVQKIPIGVLIGSFGIRLGNYLYKAVRGIHMEKGIVERNLIHIYAQCKCDNKDILFMHMHDSMFMCISYIRS